MRSVCPAAIEIIKRYERPLDGDPSTPTLDPYLDPAGYATIGWGHAIRNVRGALVTSLAEARRLYPNGITGDHAEILLRVDILRTARHVERQTLGVSNLTDDEFGALVSLAFNIGEGSFATSTLLKKLTSGDRLGARRQFSAWVKATDPKTRRKTILLGLVNRRTDEADLFMPFRVYVEQMRAAGDTA